MMKLAAALSLALATIGTPALAQAPRNEAKAITMASALVFVPTYCPGWGVDVNRYRQLLALTGVSENELRVGTMQEKVRALVDYLGSGDGDKRRLCTTFTQALGPTGSGMLYPR